MPPQNSENIAPAPGMALALNASFLGFFAHAGFLAGLEEIGVRPSKLAGSSAGAFAGGLYAAGLSPDAIHNFLFSSRLKSHFVEKRSFLRGPAVLLGLRGRTGVITGNKIARHLRTVLGDRRIEDCRAPELSLALTNLTEQRSEITTEGDLVEHIVASCSFPGIFGTRRIGGCEYWDGGIVSPMPFQHFSADPEVDVVVMHRVYGGDPEECMKKSNISAAFHLAHLAISKDFFQLRSEEARAAGKTIIELDTFTPRLGFLDREADRHACYDEGLKTAHKNAACLKKLTAHPVKSRADKPQPESATSSPTPVVNSYRQRL